MMKESCTHSARWALMGLGVLAILSMAGTPVWGTSGDWDDLVTDDFTGRESDVWVGVWSPGAEELNLLPPGALHPGSPGAKINGNLHVAGPLSFGGGGTVNIEYAVITGFIAVGGGANVTIKGKHFEVISGDGVLDNPTNPTTVSFKTGGGVLLVTYQNGSSEELEFYASSQDIYLEAASSAVGIGVDIKPDSDENVINPKSKGLIPVAIYATTEFDATQIDPASIDLGGAKVASRGRGGKLMAHPEDVNGDGLMDLMFQVELPSEGAATMRSVTPAWVTGEVKLSGKTFDGQEVEGSDKIVVMSAEE